MSKGCWIATSLLLSGCMSPVRLDEERSSAKKAPLEERVEASAERIEETAKDMEEVQEDLAEIKKKLKAQKRDGRGVFAKGK